MTEKNECMYPLHESNTAVEYGFCNSTDRKQHQQIMQQNRTLRTESMLMEELLQGDECVSKYAKTISLCIHHTELLVNTNMKL